MKRIKKLFPIPIKTYLGSIIRKVGYQKKRKKITKNLLRLRHNTESLIFIIATPEHGNLGDQAIVYAEKEFLRKNKLGDKIIEIPNDFYLSNKCFLKQIIKKTDIIILDGGGNLGTLWPWEDDKISEIIDTYSKNQIIIFPQTCYYDNSAEGKRRLEKNRFIYEKSPNLTISLRDKSSYNFCKSNFPNTNFILVPDIVFSLYGLEKNKHTRRDGVLLCLREDKERVVSREEIDTLKKYLENENIVYEETSTLTDYPVSITTRDSELEKKWIQFRSSRLVITDRLHGMIFATINGTPCLALDNLSKKVSGGLGLLPNNSCTKVCGNINELLPLIKEMYEPSEKGLEVDFISHENYSELKNLLINIKRTING
ncbi:MAG: polysaccharide pyruvyl transferase family protein [Phocaeicola sp.]